MDRIKKITFKEKIKNIKTSFKSLKWYEIIMIIIMIIIASIAVVEAYLLLLIHLYMLYSYGITKYMELLH